MPGYKGHVFFGFFLLAIVAWLDLGFGVLPKISSWWWLAYAPIVIFASILPDIDTPASKSRWVVMVIGLLLIIGLTLNIAIAGMAWWKITYIFITAVTLLIPWFLKHRGITHSFFAGAAFSAPLFLLGGWQLFTIGLLAFWSHLILDFAFTLFEHGHVQIRLI